MATALLPCPFCGSDDLTITNEMSQWFVECANPRCLTRPCTFHKDKDEAYDQWNTREVGVEVIAQEAYTLRWLRGEAEEAGWDLLDLVEAARAKKLVRILPRKKAPPVRFEEEY